MVVPICKDLPVFGLSQWETALECNAFSHWWSRTQTTFSNAFSWMKLYGFRFNFNWSLFLRVQLTLFQHWFRKLLGADQATSHYLYQWWSNLLTHICVTRLLCNLKPHTSMYLWGRHNDRGEVIEWNAPVCRENLSSEKSQLQFKHSAHKDWLQASTKLSQHFCHYVV